MHVRFTLPAFVLLSLMAASFGGDRTSQTVTELMESQKARIASFPSTSEDCITLWLQETPKRGRGIKLNVDEWQASSTVKFFAVDKSRNDIHHVLVISGNGRSLRLLDLERDDAVLHRGDILAIMLRPEIK